MITKIQKGHPCEVKEKRRIRIEEAINFEIGTKEEPKIHVIDIVNSQKVYFSKPGKEFFRKSSNNPNDMTPCVGEMFDRYSFADIWKDLLNLSLHISKDSYKQLNVILYRLAYLMDCPIIDGKVRFRPEGEIYQIIQKIQEEINRNGHHFHVLEFLCFIDVLAWNEDVKYQADCTFAKPRTGRINTILSLISIPFIFKQFVDLVIENKEHIEELDYSLLIDTAQNFSRTRGVQPMSNIKLMEYLSPYLEKE